MTSILNHCYPLDEIAASQGKGVRAAVAGHTGNHGGIRLLIDEEDGLRATYFRTAACSLVDDVREFVDLFLCEFLLLHAYMVSFSVLFLNVMSISMPTHAVGMQYLAEFRTRFDPLLKDYMTRKITELQSVETTGRLLTTVLRDFVTEDGKRLRPALVELGYRACGRPATPDILQPGI